MEGGRKRSAWKYIRAAQHLAHLIDRPGVDVGAEIDAQHGGVLDQRGLVVGPAHRETAVTCGSTPGIVARGDGRGGYSRRHLATAPIIPWRARADALDDRVDPLGETRRHEAAIAARCPARDATWVPAPRPTSRAARPRARPSGRRALPRSRTGRHRDRALTRTVPAPRPQSPHTRSGRIGSGRFRSSSLDAAMPWFSQAILPADRAQATCRIVLEFKPTEKTKHAPPYAVAPRQIRLGTARRGATTTGRSTERGRELRSQKWAPIWCGTRWCRTSCSPRPPRGWRNVYLLLPPSKGCAEKTMTTCFTTPRPNRAGLS